MRVWQRPEQRRHRPYGDRPNNGERRPYGERPNFSTASAARMVIAPEYNGERRPYGERPMTPPAPQEEETKTTCSSAATPSASA